MHISNDRLRQSKVRMSIIHHAGTFILVSVLAAIISLIVYDKHLSESGIFATPGIAVMVILLSTMYLFIRNLVNKLDEAYNKMELVAITDGLTQLFNRKHFNFLFKNELDKAVRHERNLSCFILGIDHFKIIVDKYGHQFGNEILQGTAEVIKDNSRSTDILARYDRDKFICLLPETEIESALILSKRLRAIVEGEIFDFGEDSKTIRVTISNGVTSYKPCLDKGKEIDIYKIIDIADKALGIAKNKGSNSEEYLISENL